MNGRLYLARGPTVADPDHAVARLLTGVKNSDYVAGAEFDISLSGALLFGLELSAESVRRWRQLPKP